MKAIIKKLWESNGVYDEIDARMRLLDLGEEDCIFEVKFKQAPFWSKFATVFRYIFNCSNTGIGHFVVNRKDIIRLSEALKDVKK